MRTPLGSATANAVLGDAPMTRRAAAIRLFSAALPLAVLALTAGPAAASTPSTETKLGSLALARRIDEAIDARIRSEQVSFSPRCDDAEFLRRVYLDLTGHIPTVEKATAFLDNRDANKRAKLIDELLAGSDYGKHQADIWQS